MKQGNHVVGHSRVYSMKIEQTLFLAHLRRPELQKTSPVPIQINNRNEGFASYLRGGLRRERGENKSSLVRSPPVLGRDTLSSPIAWLSFPCIS